MSFLTSTKMINGSLALGACALLCVAMLAQAQYNTYDSDSNSDSDGSPILSNSELGKLVRNSGKAHNQYNQHQLAAATKNLYNRQQPLQYAPTQHRRNYGSPSDGLSGYGPVMGAASNGRGSNLNSESSDDDDDSGSSLGPGFGSNYDGDSDGERSNAYGGDGQTLNLNQAASGYPGQGDYSNDAGSAGFGFGGASGYGPSGGEGSEFGPSDGYSGEGRRAKSASSPMGARNYGSDDDAGAPQYGPNSAINSGDVDDEGRSGYAPDGQGDGDNDDE